MLWINFLHCYQPVNVDAHIIEEATEKGYERLIGALEENPDVKFTMNFSGCLFLRWKELGYERLAARIGALLGRGQIELVGTAAYHPIMPLAPPAEVVRQIEENERILRKYFGAEFKPRGFFMPEMAYGEEAAKIIKEAGYDWLILDEIAHNGRLGETDFGRVYLDAHSGLKVVFRNRQLSKSYVPDTLLGIIEKTEGENTPVITATDGELYGLRHEDPDGRFEELLGKRQLRTMLISEFIDAAKTAETAKLRPSSWESSEEELKSGKPYILWYDRKNKVQQKLWRLARLAYDTIENYKDDKYYDWARWHLVRGLASCTFWWASAKDFRLFGPISWGPDEIERGTNELIRAIRAIDDESSRETKIKAERLYIAIKRLVWERHWAYYWKRT